MDTNNNTFGNNIEIAVAKLKASELVSFPTETVYGLGADAENLPAVQKVYAAKGRPADHPLIVHISSVDKLDFWAQDIPKDALILANHFWPGPLTLVLKKQSHVLKEITGGQDTVAVRVPRHPMALSLLRNFNGMVGPSANKYGDVSPTRAVHVIEDFDDEISYVLDGGASDIGIESTIVNCTGSEISILRAGDITQVEISQALQRPVNLNQKSSIKVPGAKESHYAPSKPLFVLGLQEIYDRLKVNNLQQRRSAVLSFNNFSEAFKSEYVSWYKVDLEPKVFNKFLYKNIRDMDKLDVDELIIESPGSDSCWQAAMDRLSRACKKI